MENTTQLLVYGLISGMTGAATYAFGRWLLTTVIIPISSPHKTSQHLTWPYRYSSKLRYTPP